MAKKTAATSSTTSNASSNGSGKVFETGVAKLMTLALQMTQQCDAMDLANLTPEERVHTMGKLRTGEPAAMNAVFNTIDQNPGVFVSLAGVDGGTDTSAVETAPARTMLARSQDMGPVVTAVQAVLQRMTDDVIASANKAKELTVPAYAIGRANAGTNPKLKATLAPALAFYGEANRLKTARTKRAASKQAKAAKKAKTAGT